MQTEQDNRESAISLVKNNLLKLKEIIYPCQPFVKSVEYYHHNSRHTKLVYLIAFFPSNFF